MRHRVPTQEGYWAQLRQTYEWAGEEIPDELAASAPDAPCFDTSDRKVLRAVRQAKGDADGWKSFTSVREYLGLAMHDNKHSRPLGRLIDQGKIETKTINHTTHVRAVPRGA